MVKTKLPNFTEGACVFQVPDAQSLCSPVNKGKEAQVEAFRCTRLCDEAASWKDASRSTERAWRSPGGGLLEARG